MNPRVLAAWSAAGLGLALISTNPFNRAVVLLAALNVTVALTPRHPRLTRALLTIAVAATGAVVLTALFSHTGAHTLLVLPAWIPGLGGAVTLEAIVYGFSIALGLLAAMASLAPLSLVLDPHQLIDALPRRLERTAIVVGTALALVPGLANSVTAVRDAQMMRGWRPRGLRSWAEIVSPVVVGAMESSLQLAETMEARGYGSGFRTRYALPRSGIGDLLVALASALAVALTVVARVIGADPDWYPFPRVTPPPMAPLSLLAALLLLTPVLVWRRPSSIA